MKRSNPVRRVGSKVKRAGVQAVSGGLRSQLPGIASDLMQFGQFWPHDPGAPYSRPIPASESFIDPGSDLPVPPEKYWAYYCTSPESFLRTGKEDVDTMSRLLGESDFQIAEAGKVLEFGCAGGRLLRWLAPLAPETQLWGSDIWSSAILWCQDHLSPPCNFVTNTTVPHLPFEDRSLGLVFCGSVFTHLDDLVEAWFLEMHRIIRPGGRLYFSINDRSAVRVFDGEALDPSSYPRYYERTAGKENWDVFVDMLNDSPEYQRFKRGDAYMVTLGRSIGANVLWDSKVLCDRLSWGYKACSVTPEAYGHQTAILLERI
jgi:SAM-dependent methyltransferase